MIHIEDGFANKQFVCSDTRKNIFLIGDSIRIGYCGVTRENLRDVAEVFFIEENCKNTQNVITSLYTWANMFSDPGRIDVVHINCGHWDVAHWCGAAFSLTSEAEYRRNLQTILQIVSVLFPKAKVLFATTTSMNPNGQQGINIRTNDEIVRYNDIMKRVAAENGIVISDLFAITREWDSSRYEDYCHFTPDANVVLGTTVAQTIRSVL